jgi:hypothetical protein
MRYKIMIKSPDKAEPHCLAERATKRAAEQYAYEHEGLFPESRLYVEAVRPVLPGFHGRPDYGSMGED